MIGLLQTLTLDQRFAPNLQTRAVFRNPGGHRD